MADKIRKFQIRANSRRYRANSRDKVMARIMGRIPNIVILYIEFLYIEILF